MADKEKVIKRIKDGGTLAIYIGTASLVKPAIFAGNEERNPVTKVCAVASGTVISLGIANFASKYYEKLVDKVTNFIDDVRPSKKESAPNG